MSVVTGPPGVLPPNDWAVGARCVNTSLGAATPRPCLIDGFNEELGHHSHPGVWMPKGFPHIRLDLSTGALDFGTRALLELADPDAAQPLIAPGWCRDPYESDGQKACVYWLGDFEEGTAICFFDPENNPEGYEEREADGYAVPGIDTAAPREALALALAQLAGRSR